MNVAFRTPEGAPAGPLVSAAMARQPADTPSTGVPHHGSGARADGLGWPAPPAPGGGGLGWPGKGSEEPSDAMRSEPEAADGPRGWRRFFRGSSAA